MSKHYQEREIKFRFWDGKKIIVDYQDASIWHGLLVCEGDTIPMQFTGLLDRFGKEVFEGDIIEIQTPTSELKGSKVSVVFKNGCFCDGYYGWRLSQHKEHNIEIIGNIYENPELLKAEEK